MTWVTVQVEIARLYILVVCMQSQSVFTLPMRQDLRVIGPSVVMLHW